MKIKIYIRKLIFRLINPTFKWNPREGLGSLKIKLRLYGFFHPHFFRQYSKELSFLKANANNTYSWIYPYDFINDLKFDDIAVLYDSKTNLYYVMHCNKRLYFKRSINTEDKVKVAYYCASVEQNKKSPHCYLINNFTINRGVVLDVGAAEGILCLESIEKVEKLYLFEVEQEWIEALEATYRPWKDKVVIINKYVSDIDSQDNVKLDTIIQDNIIELIKIDVEGVERKIFAGAKNLLSRTEKIAVCTYHKYGDEGLLNNFLCDNNFKTHFSEGVVLFILSKLRPPYFRKCLIRAVKN